jgi:hypothetical protein
MEMSDTHHFFPCRSGFDDFPFVPDGPYRKQRRALTCLLFGMLGTKLRSAALGILVTCGVVCFFWAFTPLMLKTYMTYIRNNL